MKTLYTFFVILLISVSSNGQDIAPNFIALSVKDIDAQQKWYCEKLSFKAKKPIATVAPGIRFSLLDGNGMMIELIEDKKSPSRPAGNALPHGIFKFGFKVNGFDKLLASLAAMGVVVAKRAPGSGCSNFDLHKGECRNESLNASLFQHRCVI